MAAPRGAGRSGGLLFIALLLFTAYLVVRAVAGLVQLLLLLGIAAVIAVAVIGVLRR